MKGIEYLLNGEEVEDIYIKKKKNEYIINNNRVFPSKEKRKKKKLYFDGHTFLAIIKKMKKIISIEKTPEEQKEKIIVFKLDNTIFKDKAAYILLESLVYLICRDYNFNIKMSFEKLEVQNIYQSEMKNIFEIYKNKYIDKKIYLEEFGKFFISAKRFRKIIKYEEFIENKEYLSIIATELNAFFKIYFLEDTQNDLFVETLSELIGNACEHGKSDCLIDINAIPNLRKNYLESAKVGFDIVIYNFSDNLLGTAIERILSSPKIKLHFKEVLEKAYLNHSKYFSKNYTIEDFYNIAAFQWRVSSRLENKGISGGTGLTRLIDALMEFSVKDKCYVYSGKNVIGFNKKYLKLTSTNKNDETYNLVGFNEKADFINYPPDKRCILWSPFFLKGTLYNLVFIMKTSEGV